ncbi:hypothetical protein EVAR_74916_1 [Eumeta japonica]|uniref:Uncharacterized protein n=1 Tax=Eumeta variegata TaxID=151549 RepID=A0A4C1UJT5_EUMVA|nr:hypothetical protein EVAR_74916_1 [Eumeta japonica]
MRLRRAEARDYSDLQFTEPAQFGQPRSDRLGIHANGCGTDFIDAGGAVPRTQLKIEIEGAGIGFKVESRVDIGMKSGTGFGIKRGIGFGIVVSIGILRIARGLGSEARVELVSEWRACPGLESIFKMEIESGSEIPEQDRHWNLW